MTGVRRHLMSILITGAVAALVAGCIVSGQCMTAEDCGGMQICIEGSCVLECTVDTDCNSDQQCIDSRCTYSSGCMGCPYPDAPNGKGECNHGQCRILSCDDAWYDADADPKNGCECRITLDGVEACDGIDNNCDGYVDEGCSCTPTNDGVEICDGDDNDCDGKVDEDLACCPDDMVAVDEAFCIDRYEASMSDATAESQGADTSTATSRADVLPWVNIDWSSAKAACEAAGKRLCNPGEWLAACHGPQYTTYVYGNEYIADACNGIDAFCAEPSYMCYKDEPGYPYHLAPTASFPECSNVWEALDLNGNVWEWDSDPAGHGRGGAYNCSDSRALHQCEYMKTDRGTQATSNIGFRCCK